MTVSEIFATASFNEWLVSAFALFGAGSLVVILFRFVASLHQEYIGREYGDGCDNHD